MTSKKKCAAVFSFTGNLTFAVASVIMDLKRHCSGEIDEIVCIHDGNVTEKDKRLAQQIFATRFIQYECPLKDLSRFPEKTLSYFTIMAFSKFECLRLLDEYHKVVFFDYDIVVTGSMTDAFASCSSGVKMILDGTVSSQLLPEFREQKLEGIQMDGVGMCASLMVFEDSLPDYMGMYRFLYEVTAKFAPYLFVLDQFGFSVMIQRYGLQVVHLESNVYSLHPTQLELNKDAKILHAYGQPKFWNGLANEQWAANYAQWLSMGGQKYQKPHRLKALLGKLKRKLLA